MQLPARPEREAGPVRQQLVVPAGQPPFKVGADIRHARNLRVPSDSHRAGQLNFNPARTAGPSGGGLGIAAYLLGDVSDFQRYVSPSTDARERQNRQFFYGQDTWRVTPKLTINYGLRWELIHPEYVNEDGNGGWLDLQTGEIRVGGVGPINRAGDVEMNYKTLRPAARHRLPVEREDGLPGRLRAELRHRRLRVGLRPRRDAEPAGPRRATS